MNEAPRNVTFVLEVYSFNGFSAGLIHPVFILPALAVEGKYDGSAAGINYQISNSASSLVLQVPEHLGESRYQRETT